MGDEVDPTAVELRAQVAELTAQRNDLDDKLHDGLTRWSAAAGFASAVRRLAVMALDELDADPSAAREHLEMTVLLLDRIQRHVDAYSSTGEPAPGAELRRLQARVAELELERYGADPRAWPAE